MVPAQDTFDTLMAQVRAGDPAAFEVLVREYGPAVERAARVLLGRLMRVQFDTLDLLQTVHRALLMGLRAGTLSALDSNHLRNLALTLLRRKIARRWRHMKRLAEVQPPGENGNGSSVPEHLDPGPDPAAEASIHDETQLYLQVADPTDRYVLELRLKGFTTADVARELGMDAKVLRVRLGRLRKRLREASHV